MKRLAAAGVMALVLVGVGATSAHAATAGQFCSPEGATATDSKGRALVCDNEDANGKFHWTVSSQVATTVATTATTVATTQATTATTSAGTVQSNVQATTPTTALPHTGARENSETALGFGVLLLGIVAVAWARPRIAAVFAGPKVIEQERIDRAHELLGWSEPWDEHFRSKR